MALDFCQKGFAVRLAMLQTAYVLTLSLIFFYVLHAIMHLFVKS